MNATAIITRSRGSDTDLDAIEKAMTDLRTGAAYTEPDLVIMNPSNYDTVRLAKASTAGTYLLGQPDAGGPKNLWGGSAHS